MVATREEMELRVFFWGGGGVGLSLELRVGGGENKRNLGVLEWGIRVCEQRKERLVRGTSFFFNLQGCFIFQTFCRSCGVQLQEVTPAAPRGRTSNSKGSHQQLQGTSKIISMASKRSCDPIDPTVALPQLVGNY
ncbi:hypothetical protein ACFX15_018341 [Malus domestica]